MRHLKNPISEINCGTVISLLLFLCHNYSPHFTSACIELYHVMYNVMLYRDIYPTATFITTAVISLLFTHAANVRLHGHVHGYVHMYGLYVWFAMCYLC